jgi:glycerol-3-phosphate dehydrogenase
VSTARRGGSSDVRQPLHDLANERFDVAVIGGGINGASSAYHLAAAGYKVLVVEQWDFGAGASSRSSRLLHCGLMYLAPYDSYWKMLRHPGHVLHGMQMARCSMRGRSDFAEHFPHRLSAFQFYFPLSEGQRFSSAEIRLGFGLLRALHRRGPKLDHEHLDAARARSVPFLGQVTNPQSLRGAIRLEESKYLWPERIVADYILKSERAGAIVRNYVAVESLSRSGGTWQLGLRETRPAGNEAVAVAADVVLNLTGVWADRVNRLANPLAYPRVGMTKGTHIAVKLPLAYRAAGFVTMQPGEKGPYFCVPWNDLHYIGPSRTAFDGDIDNVRPSEADIFTLLDDTATQLPGLGLKRSDVLFAWAGVRPQTFDLSHPLKAAHARKLHDMASEGMPNLFVLTSSPIMYQKQTGEEMLELVSSRLKPSRPRVASPEERSAAGGDEQDVVRDLEAQAPRLRALAVREHCVTLADLLCRRLGACWNEGLGLDIAPLAARIVAPAMGWDGARVEQEIDEYSSFINRAFVGPFPRH